MADTPLLIAGLGNPGGEYARNRHNVGFMAVDTIHGQYRFGPWKVKNQGEVAEGTLAGRKTFLVKPLTYMNESGRCVGPLAKFYKLPLRAIVAIHDELDLAAGKLKVKTGGGDAGHNGLRSLTAALGPNYRRVRIGVGHPGDKSRVHGHVLGNFAKSDEDWLVPMLAAIADAAPLLAQDDDAGFMNKVALLTQPAKPPKPAKDLPKD